MNDFNELIDENDFESLQDAQKYDNALIAYMIAFLAATTLNYGKDR